ncbi:MAG: 8-oxo-dGTP diphosphatase [Caldilineaceae bacterium]|nr:8-oxo-dGTP diphosphatase [Caldilineaceae bacterium]
MLKLATLCYVRTASQTLMLHRIKKANDMHAGKWNGLGGKLLPGETPEACAIREVQEESGLTMHSPLLRGVLTFPGFPSGQRALWPTDDPRHQDPNLDDWYTFVFESYDFSGTLSDSNEGVLAWIDNDQLLALNLWEGDRIFLPWLDGEAFFSGRFVYVDGVLQEHDVTFYHGRQVMTTATPQPTAPEQKPHYHPVDDTYCWVCHGGVIKRHCKIVCVVCGFTRDCSDP